MKRILENLPKRAHSLRRNRRRLFHNCPVVLHQTCNSNIQSLDNKKKPKLVYNRGTGIVSDPVSDQNLFRSVIGLEIHAQLLLPTKLFSSAPTKHFSAFFPSHSTLTTQSIIDDINQDYIPNSLVSPFDLGYPGTLPILSQSAVQAAVKTAHALQCNIAPYSRFERKHYHYADLPLGYQMTQQRWPIATRGQLACRHWVQKPNQQDTRSVGMVGTTNSSPTAQDTPKVRRRGQRKVEPYEQTTNTQLEHDSTTKDESRPTTTTTTTFTAYIDRIQLEQDTGKTISVSQSDSTTSTTETYSYIDFNRAGCALVEIVFTPCIFSAYEAASVVSTLQSLLKFIGTCDGKMESGSLRCDLNISIAPLSHDMDPSRKSVGENPYEHKLPLHTGHRVEVKNLNSIRQIILSAEYEAIRQATQRLQGNPTGRETRTWDPKLLQTVKIRNKGDAVDYRFMPEPDLPFVVLNEEVRFSLGRFRFLMHFFLLLFPISLVLVHIFRCWMG